MIKRIFIFIFAMSVVCGYAQLSQSKSNFKGGLRIGFSASQISGDDLAGFNKFGAYAGGFVNFPISQNGKWKIQPELNFIMKGSSTYIIPDENGYMGDKYVLNLLYIEVPVLFKYTLFKNFEVELGPTFNVLFYESEKDYNGRMLHRQPFRWYEISIVGGISYLIKNHYGVNLRYSSSIIPVRVPDFVFNRIVKKQFNEVLAFSFFYQF